MNQSQSQSKNLRLLEERIGQERLRQARYSFNIALTASAAFTAIGFVGAAMLLLGRIPEGTLVASSGILSSAGCIRLAKDANDRLDRTMNELLDEAGRIYRLGE
jgi:hypothetical protein